MKRSIFVVTALSLLMLVGCTEGQSTEPFMGDRSFDTSFLTVEEISALPMLDSVTVDISDHMVFLREEEKVARDVYLTLASAWNMRVFSNIARSEQRHMDAVKVLLDRYGLVDPVGANGQGTFTNPDLQQLHDDLVARGMGSVQEALQVGRLIEEVDIEDLDEAILLVAADSDIAVVLSSLKKGSENHLAAFIRNIERLN